MIIYALKREICDAKSGTERVQTVGIYSSPEKARCKAAELLEKECGKVGMATERQLWTDFDFGRIVYFISDYVLDA